MIDISAGFSSITYPRPLERVVHVTGDLDLLGGLDLDARLSHDPAAPCGEELVLDLSDVPFMDCAGLGAVLRARVRYGQRFRLRGVQPRVRRFLDLAEVADVLPVDDPSSDLAGETMGGRKRTSRFRPRETCTRPRVTRLRHGPESSQVSPREEPSMRFEPYVMRVRTLRLRGGPGDGQTWTGDIEVGRRIACAGPWSTDGVYVVTSETVTAPDGRVETIAVPV